jgi:hypothetical protein
MAAYGRHLGGGSRYAWVDANRLSRSRVQNSVPGVKVSRCSGGGVDDELVFAERPLWRWKRRGSSADVCQEMPLSQPLWGNRLPPRVSAKVRRSSTNWLGSTNAGEPHSLEKTPNVPLPTPSAHHAGRGSPAVMDDQSLRSRASQATLVSLLELDPTPMESPNTEKDLPPLPDQADGAPADSVSSLKSSSTSTSLGLSGSSHGAIYYRTSPFSTPFNNPKLSLTDTP